MLEGGGRGRRGWSKKKEMGGGRGRVSNVL